MLLVDGPPRPNSGLEAKNWQGRPAGPKIVPALNENFDLLRRAYIIYVVQVALQHATATVARNGVLRAATFSALRSSGPERSTACPHSTRGRPSGVFSKFYRSAVVPGAATRVEFSHAPSRTSRSMRTTVPLHHTLSCSTQVQCSPHDGALRRATACDRAPPDVQLHTADPPVVLTVVL